ncbi:MAG: hypothetical protein K2L39_08290 [Muribaculaceae bacterium]|nr:hypothetical protein [Muribaculaceae bacterium]
MKNLKLYLSVACIVAMMLVTGCRGQKEVSATWSNYEFGTSYVNASPSGEVTIRSWGSGPDKAGAIEAAMKNAVNDVIFKGIKGGNGYTSQPIVTEVNARERYAEYFDRFFADGGEYKRFVKETSGSDMSRTKSKSDGRENFGVTVTVDRPALVRQLRDDNVINH